MDRGNLGPGYYQDLNGYRGQGQYADFNKIQRTETTYVQGYPNQQMQGSGSILKDSLKKSIFGNQDELNVNLNRSKPPSRALTPTHKLRGRDDSYGYQPGTQNIGGYDPRTSDAHMNQNSGYGIQQQQYQTPYGQDPYRNQLQGTRTPGQNPSQINQSQGYYGQNQPVQTNQGQMYSQTQQGFQQTQYSPYPQTQLTYGQTQSHTKGQVLMTNPTPLKTQDPLQRTSTVVKVDPLLAAQNISNKSPYFAEKRVIVTGASSGIGRAVAMW